MFACQYVCLDKLLDITGYVPDARWCDFSYLTHDFEPFASSCLGHPNHLTLIQLSVIGMSSVFGRVVRRQRLANERGFTSTAISNGWMERNYTAHDECLGYMYVTLMRSHCQTVIDANGGHSRYSVQLICVVIIEFGNFIHVMT